MPAAPPVPAVTARLRPPTVTIPSWPAALLPFHPLVWRWSQPQLPPPPLFPSVATPHFPHATGSTPVVARPPRPATPPHKLTEVISSTWLPSPDHRLLSCL